ncbi:hydroquinone glucosyltransferase-like [Prosopis cineraria]|uniref:hydroquinone glucosyltransferase-like n=1 Tax=Prosopis cineraria TaxID=364024 RepID=UPI00240F7E0A|nr:hydroquinone glucosyltransferase-like [Prosopis cineraria]
MAKATTTHIAVIPSAGFSHLVPIIEFSKRLLHLHSDFHVTCIIPSLAGSSSSSSTSYLQTLPSNINPIFLPPVPHHNITDQDQDNNHPGLQVQRTVTLSLPFIREALKSLMSSSNHGLVALVADVFAMEVLEIGSELNILSYVYFPLSAMVLSVYFYIPKLEEIVSNSEFRDFQDPIKMPGCVPVHGRDLTDSVQDRSSLVYKQFLERSRRFSLADGVLVNSFTELETETIKALQEEMKEKKKPMIHPVGPVLHSGSGKDQNGSDCLSWLNNQRARSVLYVSFGSGGTLTQEQVNELALGLELSGEKFLWVVRSPSKVASAAYLDDNSNDENPLDFLPEGFLERTKEKGFVIPYWAPQIQILKHSSTGGFLSHCGWNSVLESIQEGVPLIAWPLFAEQRTNAVLLTDGLKVALRLKVNENGIVEREEIAKLVRSLMEGEEGKEIRRRMKDLSDASANALKEDGSSAKTLRHVALKWKNLSGT